MQEDPNVDSPWTTYNPISTGSCSRGGGSRGSKVSLEKGVNHGGTEDTEKNEELGTKKKERLSLTIAYIYS